MNCQVITESGEEGSRAESEREREKEGEDGIFKERTNKG